MKRVRECNFLICRVLSLSHALPRLACTLILPLQLDKPCWIRLRARATKIKIEPSFCRKRAGFEHP